MKLAFTYNFAFDVDIPEEEVKKVLAIEDNEEQGEKFDELTRKYAPDAWDRIWATFSSGDIQGVYNPCGVNRDGSIYFFNEGYPEAIWES